MDQEDAEYIAHHFKAIACDLIGHRIWNTDHHHTRRRRDLKALRQVVEQLDVEPYPLGVRVPSRGDRDRQEWGLRLTYAVPADDGLGMVPDTAAEYVLYKLLEDTAGLMRKHFNDHVRREQLDVPLWDAPAVTINEVEFATKVTGKALRRMEERTGHLAAR